MTIEAAHVPHQVLDLKLNQNPCCVCVCVLVISNNCHDNTPFSREEDNGCSTVQGPGGKPATFDEALP